MALPPLALLAILASGAPAQDPGAQDRQADPVELDRILVTARRRPEPLQAVPGAVTAVSGEELE